MEYESTKNLVKKYFRVKIFERKDNKQNFGNV